ncbi:MAG: hypothetical protein ACKO23_06775, partial [Gemmataceae bacterium]
KTWNALIQAFSHLPSEQAWVDKAIKSLEQKEAPTSREGVEAVRTAMTRARQLRSEGKKEEADAVIRSLKELYADRPLILKTISEEASTPSP